MGRRALTGLIGIIPFIQVIYGAPLWNPSGCGQDLVLKLSQHQMSVGLWSWLAIWVWWGFEKVNKGVGDSLMRHARIRMGPVGKRLVAAIGVLPLIVGLSAIIQVAAVDLFPKRWAPEFPSTICIIATACWLVIWRPLVGEKLAQLGMQAVGLGLTRRPRRTGLFHQTGIEEAAQDVEEDFAHAGRLPVPDGRHDTTRSIAFPTARRRDRRTRRTYSAYIIPSQGSGSRPSSRSRCTYTGVGAGSPGGAAIGSQPNHARNAW